MVLRGIGKSLKNPGDSTVIRKGRNHLIKCRFGATFAILNYNRWTGKTFEQKQIQVTSEQTFLFNDTGKDATLSLTHKDPIGKGDVRVVRLSSLAEEPEAEHSFNPNIYTDMSTLTMEQSDTIAFSAEEATAIFNGHAEAAVADAPLNGGGVIAVRCFIQVQGQGIVKANTFSTANGISGFWVKPGQKLRCTATPAPGQIFVRWELNGNFAGTDAVLMTNARKGLTIKGIFDAEPVDPDPETLLDSDATRPDPEATAATRIVNGGLNGQSEQTLQIRPGETSCVVKYNSGTIPDIVVRKNGSQLANLGPNTQSSPISVKGGDRIKVEKGLNGKPGQKASFSWIVS